MRKAIIIPLSVLFLSIVLHVLSHKNEGWEDVPVYQPIDGKTWNTIGFRYHGKYPETQEILLQLEKSVRTLQQLGCQGLRSQLDAVNQVFMEYLKNSTASRVECSKMPLVIDAMMASLQQQWPDIKLIEMLAKDLKDLWLSVAAASCVDDRIDLNKAQQLFNHALDSFCPV